MCLGVPSLHKLIPDALPTPSHSQLPESRAWKRAACLLLPSPLPPSCSPSIRESLTRHPASLHRSSTARSLQTPSSTVLCFPSVTTGCSLSFRWASGAFWVLHLFLLCPEHSWHGSQCVVEKLRLHGGGIPMVERKARGRAFLGPQRTCALGSWKGRMLWPSLHHSALNSCIGPSRSLLPL